MLLCVRPARQTEPRDPRIHLVSAKSVFSLLLWFLSVILQFSSASTLFRKRQISLRGKWAWVWVSRKMGLALFRTWLEASLLYRSAAASYQDVGSGPPPTSKCGSLGVGERRQDLELLCVGWVLIQKVPTVCGDTSCQGAPAFPGALNLADGCQILCD